MRMQSIYLDEDLPFEGVWGGQVALFVCLDGREVQLVAHHLHQVLGHLLLLGDAAVVLYGQDHWVADRDRHGLSQRLRLEDKDSGTARDKAINLYRVRHLWYSLGTGLSLLRQSMTKTWVFNLSLEFQSNVITFNPLKCDFEVPQKCTTFSEVEYVPCCSNNYVQIVLH